MHASVNVGCQGKSGPGKIHEVILVVNNDENDCVEYLITREVDCQISLAIYFFGSINTKAPVVDIYSLAP